MDKCTLTDLRKEYACCKAQSTEKGLIHIAKVRRDAPESQILNFNKVDHS